MSYWCGGYRKQPSEMILLMHKIACYFAKQHYGECHLIADELGAKYLKDCGFSSITILNELNLLPKEYNGEPWSWSKMITYKYLAEKNIHFVHLDYDVFLFKRLPEFIEKAEVFAQSEELNVRGYYGVETFLKLTNDSHLIKEVENLNGSNCGIFGGTNLNFIHKYAKSSIEMILEKNNKIAWSNSSAYNAMWCRAVIAEQFYLNVCSKYFNKPITYLFQNHPPTEEETTKYGYTHLWGVKDNPHWQNQIKQIAQKLNL